MTQTLARLARIAPPDRAAGWDPVGLQLGHGDAPAGRIAVCHEVTDGVVAALELFDLVVAYHPLLFRPTRTMVAGPGPEGRALRLVEAGTALAVAHTNFDVAPGGTADALASSLGIGDVEQFGPLDGDAVVKVAVFVPHAHADRISNVMADAGAGAIGNYRACSYRLEGTGAFRPEPGAAPVVGEVGTEHREPETRVEMLAPKRREAAVLAAIVNAHPYEEPAVNVFDVRSNPGMIGRVGSVEPTAVTAFGDLVAETVGGMVRVAGSGTVERVAVVPGSGADFIGPARAMGADVLITGDVSHHRARTALDSGLKIIDPGHIATERPGLEALYAAVRDIADDVEMVSAADIDPWEQN